MWQIPEDSRINQKEVEKITKYQDLKVKAERLWEKKALVVTVVIGTLRAKPRDLVKHLKTIGLEKILPSQLQKAALLLTTCENTSEIPRSSERTRTAGAQKHTGARHLVDMRIKRNNNNNDNNINNNKSCFVTGNSYIPCLGYGRTRSAKSDFVHGSALMPDNNFEACQQQWHALYGHILANASPDKQ